MLVLWVVALLVIIAVGLTATQRTESTLAANQRATARFRALAEAGINYAVLNLTANAPLVQDDELTSDLWVPDGSAYRWSFAGEPLEIAIVNEQSLIDLNQAAEDLIGSLLLAAGVPEEEKSTLVDAILDWRDENDLRLLNGAEDADYEEAGRPYGAKDGPFDSVEELRQVLGFGRDLYRTLAPALTVDAGTANVEEDLAPALVRAALKGTTLEEAERLMAEEREAEEQDAADKPASAINRGGPKYRIRVSSSGAEPRMSMEALVETTPSEYAPFQILWRRYGLSAETGGGDEGSGELD